LAAYLSLRLWPSGSATGPEIFVLSVGVLGWPLAVSRLVATLMLSLDVGYLTLAHPGCFRAEWEQLFCVSRRRILDQKRPLRIA
jgi:uncharacterized membrane protein YraQ (UPF0718 family)